MKSTRQLLLLFLFGFLISCSGDDEVTQAGVSNAEAAEEIGATLATDILDMTLDIETLSEDAENGRVEAGGRTAGCGTSYDTTFTKTYVGVYISGEQTVTYGYELTCDGVIPSQLDATFSSTGTRSTARLASSASTTGIMTTTGIEPSNAAYTLNSSMTRNASVEGSEKSYSSLSNITLTDLIITKSTMIIASGSATYSYSGSTSEGKSYSYTASVTFNGDGTATIIFNDNTSFLVDLETGEVTQLT
ncbi:MAG: hypothetical protein ABJ004_02685 [Cyclobacteriaceae bacterium]